MDNTIGCKEIIVTTIYRLQAIIFEDNNFLYLVVCIKNMNIVVLHLFIAGMLLHLEIIFLLYINKCKVVYFYYAICF